MYDRGKVSFACEANLLIRQWEKDNPEAKANRFGADLLLPRSLFEPRARSSKSVDFKVVRHLAKVFRMSLTATAIRLVECGPLPAVLVCHGSSGREWFVRGAGIPKVLWPKDSPEPGTFAHDLLRNDSGEAAGEVSAGSWFDHWSAERYSLQEHSIRVGAGLVLSLLWWKQEKMLIDIDEYEERRAARRADGVWSSTDINEPDC